MKRTIAVVTTSRADYSHLYWVLRELRDHNDIECRLIVTAAHLADEFGAAVDEIEADGFVIDERIECLLSSDTDVGMAKTIGMATLGLADALDRLRPDILLLIADRYEMLAPASVALALRIPLAHIEGGDVSEGAIDDAVRNALTKMSHLHFTPTEIARQRVIAMGEEAWRVHRSGAPSLDHLERSELLDRATLEQVLDTTIDPSSILVAYHPVTVARDSLREAEAMFEGLQMTGRPVVFCFPNADVGSRQLARLAEAFCERNDSAQIFVNLNPTHYWSLLRSVAVMVGNSSSGIMETPSLQLPCINVGMRQRGRERAANIIDVGADASAIKDAVEHACSQGFRDSLQGMVNPYGDGTAARRIVDVLASCPLGEELRVKLTVDAF